MKNKKIYRLFLFVCAVLATVFFQVTFFGGLGRFFDHWHLILIALVILMAVARFDLALYFALAAGFLFDLYSDLPFGLFMVSFFATVLWAEILLVNFFTNRSFYSIVALGLMTVIFYNLFFLFWGWLLFILGLTDFNFAFGFWRGLWQQLLFLSLILPPSFVLIDKNSRIFKPVFLRS